MARDQPIGMTKETVVKAQDNLLGTVGDENVPADDGNRQHQEQPDHIVQGMGQAVVLVVIGAEDDGERDDREHPGAGMGTRVENIPHHEAGTKNHGAQFQVAR